MGTKKEKEIDGQSETVEEPETGEVIKLGESNPPRPEKRYQEEGDLLVPIEIK